MTLRRWLLAIPMVVRVFSFYAEAQDSPNRVTLTLLEVKTGDQALSAEPAAKIRSRSQTRVLVELSCDLKDDKGVARAGEDRAFPIDSTVQEDGKVVSQKSEKEFVGTELRVSRGLEKLDVTFHHDLKSPEMLRHNYDLAATGQAREERSVPAPRFERIEWKGMVPLGAGEKVIATFSLVGDPGTQVVALLRCHAPEEKPAVRIEQTIYRVPELPMIERLLKTDADDASLLAGLDAQVVSVLSTISTPQGKGEAQAASETWLPVEIEPDYDRLYQVPCAFDKALTGTSVEFETKGDAWEQLHWRSHFAPRAPLKVQWPGSWLHVYDSKTNKPTGKAITGWMDWHDRFEQEIEGLTVVTDDAPHVVSMMPPPDQVWGAERKGRWLDVTMVRRVGGAGFMTLVPEKDISSPRSLIGIRLPSPVAMTLMAKRTGKDDAALLAELLAMVKNGAASVELCAVAGRMNNQRRQVSARWHTYPTEMPSIPSAWDDIPIGTSIEMDGDPLQVEHDLAPPARMEWKLARDVPEAIMWEPSRRVLRLTSDPGSASGTHLCALTTIPSVMKAADMPAGQSVLFFTHQAHIAAVVARENDAPPEPPPPVAEVEAAIFEIPAKDAAEWQQMKRSDWSAFTSERLREVSASMEGHLVLRLAAGRGGKMEAVEEQMTAVEFDPPAPEAPGRMRPTTLDMLPCGTRIEAMWRDGFANGVSLEVMLRHTTKRPIEPGLEETLKIAAGEKEDYPGATHLFDEWKDESLLVTPGAIHCLGVRELPDTKAKVHIAFVRVRPLP